MKKTIKKNWLKALFIAFSLLLISCSVEEEVLSGSHFGPQNKKFTYSDFLKETKAKDFDIFAKYNVSRSENGVMQKSIQQDFITDTTEIKRFEIPNSEKTTYSFKLYPLAEELNAKEYYNMVVEKNGNQLTYMVFFNKDKQNPAPSELRTQTSQMVFNSRSPHSGFSEVITYHFHCTQTGSCASGVCDQCSLCVSETVSYLYISSGGSSGGSSGSGGSGTGGSGGGGGGSSPLDGFYIPNPYDGIDVNDPSNSILQLSFQITNFLNTLSPELKEIAKNYVNFAFAFEYFSTNGLNDATKQHYLTALTNYINFVDATANTQVNTDAQAKLEYWAFQTFLNNNENGINNTKINNVKNFLNNLNVDFLTKEKIIDELATKNNQEVLDFISTIYSKHLNNPSFYTFDRINNWFFTDREGKDPLSYDSNYWENPNLSFPQQDLPSWADFDQAFPRVSGANLVVTVGGQVQTAYNQYPSLSRGFCALKLSRALNYSGVNIPQITTTSGNPGTLLGGDGKYYFLNAKALNKWMRETFGTNPSTTTTPLNNNHHHFTALDGGESGINFPDLVNGLKGIYSLVSTNPNWASGHADLLNGDGTCIDGCHFRDNPPAPIDYIDIWVLD